MVSESIIELARRRIEPAFLLGSASPADADGHAAVLDELSAVRLIRRFFL